jgi:hypothetical protein
MNRSLGERRPATPLAIDLDEELALPVAAAARWLPAVRGTKHVHPRTIARWANEGLISAAGTRVVLETFFLGGTRVTTKEAVKRFLARLNDGEPYSVGALPATRAKPAKAKSKSTRSYK